MKKECWKCGKKFNQESWDRIDKKFCDGCREELTKIYEINEMAEEAHFENENP